MFGPSGLISGRPDFIFTMGPPEIESPYIDWTTHKKSSKSLEPLSSKTTKTPFLDLFWPSSPDFGPARFLFQNRALWLCSKYPSQSSCQKSGKSLEPFSIKWCEYLPTYLTDRPTTSAWAHLLEVRTVTFYRTMLTSRLQMILKYNKNL